MSCPSRLARAQCVTFPIYSIQEGAKSVGVNQGDPRGRPGLLRSLVSSSRSHHDEFLPELVEEGTGCEVLRGGYIFVAEMAEVVC